MKKPGMPGFFIVQFVVQGLISLLRASSSLGEAGNLAWASPDGCVLRSCPAADNAHFAVQAALVTVFQLGYRAAVLNRRTVQWAFVEQRWLARYLIRLLCALAKPASELLLAGLARHAAAEADGQQQLLIRKPSHNDSLLCRFDGRQ